MKINRILKINGTETDIVGVNIILDFYSPGRGIITVKSSAEVQGTIEFYLGLNGSYERWFTGYIESSRVIDSKQQRIIVRECAAVLDKRFPLSIRNTDASRILAALSGLSGLGFRIAGTGWAEKPISHFVNVGSGYDILESLGDISGTPSYGWNSLASGEILLGIREAAPTLCLNEKLFTGVSGSSATAPVIPALRPGRIIRIGDNGAVRITTVSLAGDMMRFEFEDL